MPEIRVLPILRDRVHHQHTAADRDMRSCTSCPRFEGHVRSHPEQDVISYLLNKGSVLDGANLGLVESHFHEYRPEYEWILDFLLKRKKAPDLYTFRQTFPEFEMTECEDLEWAVDETKRNHSKFLFAKTVRECQQHLKADEIEEALDLMSSRVMSLSKGTSASAPVVDSVREYEETFQYALDRSNDPEKMGVPFGSVTLQEQTRGMQESELWIKAARLGQGKTWDLVADSCAALLSGKDVLFYSLEMSKRQIEYRFQTILGHALGYKLTHTAISKGVHLDLREYKQMLGAIAERVPGRLLINDTSRGKITPVSIAAGIQHNGPDLVTVDYMTLLSSSAGVRSSEGWNAVAAITGELKEVATQFKIPLLVAAQINREGDRGGWKPPRAVHLAQGDSIGQDADGVVTMRRFGNGAMVNSLEKYRSGSSGWLWFNRFNPNDGDFGEISREMAEYIRDSEGEFDD